MEIRMFCWNKHYLKLLWTLKPCGGAHISKEHFHVFWCFALHHYWLQLHKWEKMRNQENKRYLTSCVISNCLIVLEGFFKNPKTFERLLKTLRNNLFTHSSDIWEVVENSKNFFVHLFFSVFVPLWTFSRPSSISMVVISKLIFQSCFFETLRNILSTHSSDIWEVLENTLFTNSSLSLSHCEPCDKRSLAAFCGFATCSWKYHFYEESSYPTVGNMVIYWTIRDQIIVWIQPGRVQLLDYYNAMLFEFAAEEIWVLWGTIQSKCCSWVIQILQIESSIWIKVYILIWCFGTLIKWPNYCKLDLN